MLFISNWMPLLIWQKVSAGNPKVEGFPVLESFGDDFLKAFLKSFLPIHSFTYKIISKVSTVDMSLDLPHTQLPSSLYPQIFLNQSRMIRLGTLHCTNSMDIVMYLNSVLWGLPTLYFWTGSSQISRKQTVSFWMQKCKVNGCFGELIKRRFTLRGDWIFIVVIA